MADRLGPEALSAEALALVGQAHLRLQQPEAAAEAFGKALMLHPGDSVAIKGIALSFQMGGLIGEAVSAWKELLRRHPDNEEARTQVVRLLRSLNQSSASIPFLVEGLQLNPEHPGWRTALASIYLDQGRIEELFSLTGENNQYCRKNAAFHANVVRATVYSADASGPLLLKTAREWVQAHTPQTVSPCKALSANPPGGKWRVGILSSTCFLHNMSVQLLNWLKHFDRDCFTIHIFHSGRKSDQMTKQIKQVADSYHAICDLSDDAAAKLIRECGIDFLIEMNEYANSGRLGILARCPAPVQYHWLGNSITTGLSRLTGRISDAFMEPDYLGDSHSSEPIVRFPTGYYAYAPHPDAVEPSFSREGPPVIGCIHHLAKYTPQFLRALRRIMEQVPSCRLLIGRRTLADAGTFQLFKQRILQAGIPAGRVTFCTDNQAIQNLNIFRQIDLVPDAFPFNGDATTHDALHSGVPVVALEGQHLAARRSSAILRHLKLDEWIVDSEDAFVNRTVTLLQDVLSLRRRREEISLLHQRSSLCDPKQLAQNWYNLFVSQI